MCFDTDRHEIDDTFRVTVPGRMLEESFGRECSGGLAACPYVADERVIVCDLDCDRTLPTTKAINISFRLIYVLRVCYTRY